MTTVAIVGAGASGVEGARLLAQALRSAGSFPPGVTLLEDGIVHDRVPDADVLIVMGRSPGALEGLGSLGGLGSPHRLVVSGIDGLDMRGLRDLVGPGPSLCRMWAGPGTVVGEAVIALVPGPDADPPLIEAVAGLLDSVGTVEVATEATLDTLSAVTVAGGGLLSLALEGMEEGALESGLPLETARPFVRQTALATALLLSAHPGSPADLKDQVASPGGTTIAGLAVLEDAGVRGAFIRAVQGGAGASRRQDAEGVSVIE